MRIWRVSDPLVSRCCCRCPVFLCLSVYPFHYFCQSFSIMIHEPSAFLMPDPEKEQAKSREDRESHSHANASDCECLCILTHSSYLTWWLCQWQRRITIWLQWERMNQIDAQAWKWNLIVPQSCYLSQHVALNGKQPHSVLLFPFPVSRDTVSPKNSLSLTRYRSLCMFYL
jgi:hypothetical protein